MSSNEDMHDNSELVAANLTIDTLIRELPLPGVKSISTEVIDLVNGLVAENAAMKESGAPVEGE